MGESPDDLAMALALADTADALTTQRFGALDLHVDTKPDLTPVTDVDRAVESALREALGAETSIEEARQKVRHALGTNSLTTLRHAKQHVESPLE